MGERDLRLAERLAERAVSELRPLSGGASSLTYTGEVGGRRVVIKVAPPGLAPIHHRDVLRQARVIRSLHPTDVPVPEVLWEDAGDPPDVPPLFAMSYLEGSSVEPLFDREGGGEAPAVVAGRLRHAARTMARLHGVVPAEVGLGEEPAVGPADEVDRWCRTLDTVDPDVAPGWRDVADELRGTVPSSVPVTIVHGDFRLGNLLAVGERVTGVIDWEIWSVGDPRVDVGWFLVNADPDTYRRPTPYSGALPTPAELSSIYADELGREVPSLRWFEALACFKSVATWSLIVKHNRRRHAPDPELEAMAPVLPRLLARASELLGEERTGTSATH